MVGSFLKINVTRHSESVLIFYYLDWQKIIQFLSCDKSTFIHVLSQELANIFCKGPDSKYFRFCGSYVLCCNYSTSVIV